MKNQSLQLLSLCAAFTGMLHGQGMQRAAAITGAGRADQGKCTIEVVVDIVAEIEIRGASLCATWPDNRLNGAGSNAPQRFPPTPSTSPSKVSMAGVGRP